MKSNKISNDEFTLKTVHKLMKITLEECQSRFGNTSKVDLKTINVLGEIGSSFFGSLCMFIHGNTAYSPDIEKMMNNIGKQIKEKMEQTE